MPSYTLEIEAYGVYASNMPSLLVIEDSVLDSTHFISSSGTSISLTINYGGALPTSLEFNFNDAFAPAGRTIEIRSVKINDKYVNVGNYLSSDSLVKGASATVDISNSSYIFDASDPALSEFTTGATRILTTGNDTVREYLSATPEIFDALAGRDIINLGSGADKVFGNAGDDIIYAGGGNDLISGGDDDDRIFGQDGDDTLYGGNGNDLIQGQDGDDEIHGGGGNDRLNGHAGNDVLTGGAGADKLNGGAGADYLFGDDDNDQLIGADGNDTIDGGNGNDLAYGGSGDDIINGGDGDDVLIGNIGSDTIYGDADDDTLYGLADNDSLYGGTGNDRLIGGAGIDSFDGGAGNDVIIGNEGYVVDVNATTLLSYAGGQDGASTITYFTGGVSMDGNPWKKIAINYVITANTVIEFDFRSTLEGDIHGIGFDSDDNIDNDTNKFKVYGTQAWNRDHDDFDNYDGSGDWAHYKIDVGSFFTGTFSHLTLIGDDDSAPTGNGSFANFILYESTMPADNETLNGGDDIDQLFGEGGDDILNGGNGADVLNGGDGDDTLNGDAGNDVLHGNDGDDTLNGGAGSDELYGGAGNNILNGGDDNDTLYGNSGSDILSGDAGDDVIYSASMTNTLTSILSTTAEAKHIGSGWIVQTYTTVGTTAWTPHADITEVYYLVVGGGGGGGGRHGGGGGGGGLVTNWGGTAYSVTATPYTITVGDGGSYTQTSPTNQSIGENGENSVFATVTALGGGGGGSYTANNTDTGGSGGGGGGVGPTTAGSGDGRDENRDGGLAAQTDSGGGTGYGNDGGTGAGPGATASNTAGGGGGGAGTAGGNASGQFGGVGGDGFQSDITGESIYYAGGGGGGSGGSVANVAAGGLGGGGNGGSLGASGTAGTDGLGGGGGGTRSDGPGGSTAATGADGGSGTVIIRYQVSTAGDYTTLAGGSGNDTLYGSAGLDIFEFSHVGAANLDTVNNFQTGADQIDISDLLTGYDPLTDAITDFVRITDSGGNSDLRVDTTGSGSFGLATQVATITGVTGLTDEAALVQDGTLII